MSSTLMIPENIAALIRDGALLVANHSGGKDSQAMLIELLKVVPREQVLVVHASLGEVEWEGALEHAQKQAEDAGVPFIVAHAVKTFLQMVEHRFAVRPNSPCWPSAANRQCTSDLKRGPITREVRRYAKAHGFTTIITCMGTINAIVRSACETDPADPDHPDTLCIGVADLRRIAEHHLRGEHADEFPHSDNGIAESTGVCGG